jgi:hypothetical protein
MPREGKLLRAQKWESLTRRTTLYKGGESEKLGGRHAHTIGQGEKNIFFLTASWRTSIGW